MTILGVDPGLNKIGYAVLKTEKSMIEFVDAGEFKPSETTLSKKLKSIHDKIKDIIENFKPEVCSIETVFYSKNPKSVILLAHARGVILALLESYGVEVVEYTPMEVKKATVGRGSASKEQVYYMVKKLLNREDLKFEQDTIDALAIALTHVYKIPSSNATSVVKKKETTDAHE